MKNNFQWMSSRFLISQFKRWVEAKGIPAPSYQIIERLEKNTFTGRVLTRRQKEIDDLAAEFRKEKELAQCQAQAA